MIVRASGNIYKLLIVHTISFLSKTTKTFHENIIFQVPSLNEKYENVLQRETYIAAQLSDNLP